jgi:hypothetical protein
VIGHAKRKAAAGYESKLSYRTGAGQRGSGKRGRRGVWGARLRGRRGAGIDVLSRSLHTGQQLLLPGTSQRT